MSRFGGCMLGGIVALAFCAGASEEASAPAGSGVLWEARTMAAQARQQLQAAVSAGRAGSVDAYRENEAKANKMFEEARRLFEEAGGLSLEDAEALADFAGVLQSLNDSDLAADALRRAARLQPDHAGLWLALGRGLLTPLYRRPQEAEGALKRAIEAGKGTPVEGEARAVLGRLYWDRALTDFAEQEWAGALEVSPDNVIAQIGMAALLARRGEMVAASQRVQQAAQASPEVLAIAAELIGKGLQDFERSGLWFEDTAEAHYAYASLLLRAGRYAESVAPLERTVKLAPENHVAWNMLGSICAQLGRAEQAREAFKRSLEIEPGQERTREALKALSSAESPASAEQEGGAQGGGEAGAAEPQGSGTGVSSGVSK
ncbi:MAG TPA: tetratricopeptide repeat protein [Candidatus Hydrogenedentes bacterium]|nr:tetratricopeptide repeat protein [Candidatus Hydrogenedentota bacterium]